MRSREQAMANVQRRMDERVKYIDYEEAKERYGLGETTIRKMAKECGALYKIGKAARIRVDVFDKYIETFCDRK